MTNPCLYITTSIDLPLKEIAAAFWELSTDDQLEVLRTLIEESSFTLEDLVEELSA